MMPEENCTTSEQYQYFNFLQHLFSKIMQTPSVSKYKTCSDLLITNNYFINVCGLRNIFLYH